MFLTGHWPNDILPVLPNLPRPAELLQAPMLRGEFSRSSPTNDRTLEMAWEQPLWAFDGVISRPTGEHGEKLNSANFVSHNFNHGIWIPKREAEVVPSMVPKCEIWDDGKTNYIYLPIVHTENELRRTGQLSCISNILRTVYIYIWVRVARSWPPPPPWYGPPPYPAPYPTVLAATVLVLVLPITSTT